MTRSLLLLLAAFVLLSSLWSAAALRHMAADLEDARTRIAQLEEDLYDQPCSTDTECEDLEPASFVEASR